MTGDIRRFSAIAKPALSKLQMLNRAAELNDLRVPPGNQLEALLGKSQGKFSIRINKQWRLCFRWTKDGPEDVEVVHYH